MGTRISGRATFGGLASGLDTNAIIDGLMQIERQPLQRIQSRRSDVEGQRSLIRQLNTKLLALRDAARGLDNRNTRLTDAATSEEFLKYAASSTNEDVVSVTAGFGAAPGDIQIVIDQLARGSRRFSTTLTATGDDADNTVALAAGQSVTISLPNADPDANPPVAATGITIAAGATDLSLSDLRDQINVSEGNGGKVHADILRIRENEFQLVLTSTGTGASNQLQVTGDLALQAANPDGSDDAQSSVFHLFGQRFERDDNEIDDVIRGVTLGLKSTSEKDDADKAIAETVSIKADSASIEKSVQDFIDAFNDVVGFINDQSKYDEKAKTAGPLSGDFMVREVQRRLREVVSSGYAFQTNPSNPFGFGGLDAEDHPNPGGSIAAVGIEVADGGKLRLDKEKFEKALSKDATSLREFFSGRARRGPPTFPSERPQNQAEIDRVNAHNADPRTKPEDRLEVPEPDFWDAGFFTNLGEQLADFVRTGDGLIAQRDKQFAVRLTQIDDSIDQFNRRLAQREDLLVKRFSALENVVAGLQNQQGFLNGIR